jgi:hypothetical protein
MATALVLSLALQQFSVAPFPCEVGQTAVFSAEQDGKPIAGLQVVVERPDGSAWDVGATDAAGKVAFVPTSAGQHLCVARRERARWVAPLQVVKKPMRWLYAAVCTPLGLALLWTSLRRRRVAPAS